MARFIPPTLERNPDNEGERIVFRRLRDDPEGTRDWIVLHSQDIKEHVRKVDGEADFVVLIPELGALVLEVKGHRLIRRDKGSWYFGDALEGGQDPVKQASDAMHSLVNLLKKERKAFEGVPFWSAAVFPNCPFSVQSPEWHTWEIIDSLAMEREPLAKILAATMQQGRHYLSNEKRLRFSKGPSVEVCEQIASVLRRDFEFFQSPAQRVQQLKNELIQYTEQQYAALDYMEQIPRLLFKGPAGTGKTMLAIEAARRSAQQGRKVLLCCFNALLGRWLEEQTAPLKGQVAAQTLHQFLLRLSGLNPRTATGEAWWQAELPARALEKARTIKEPEKFDELLLDEAQDVLIEPYLSVLNECLKGGLNGGRWRMFGDFEKQRIFARYGVSEDEARERYGAFPVPLTDNCRNTPKIAFFSTTTARMVPGYRRVLRPDNGFVPAPTYYKSKQNQREALVGLIDRLFSLGYSPGDIVILSPSAEAPCARSLAGTPHGSKIVQCVDRTPYRIGYTTIHAFKGMEAPIVIVTDIDSLEGEQAEMLLYIAATRATDRLYVLAHESVSNYFVEAFSNATVA